jgi:glycine cleavage system transcriptional repressor
MSAPMAHHALSAIGRDRPGIVAAVSRVLLDHDANIEDSQMTILRGHFTMMLVVALPEGADADALRGDLEAVRGDLGLEALTLGELGEADPAAEPVPTHILTVYGADHPGIVHAVTAALAERGVDITDLNTKLVAQEPDPPLYALMMEIAPPGGLGAAELRSALEGTAADQGVEVTLRELDPDAL